MAYTHILFDADGTLFDFQRSEQYSVEKFFRAHGLTFSNELYALFHRINDRYWLMLEQGKIDKSVLQVERFREFLSVIGLPGWDPAACNREYLNYLGECSFLMEGAEEICRYLAERYHLALVTNGISSVQHNRLAGSPLVSYIQTVVVSEDAGFSKPETGYFDYAFQRLGNPAPKSCLIVGDSLLADIGGGAAYGLDTCWYNPKGQPEGELRPTYQIWELAELRTFL